MGRFNENKLLSAAWLTNLVALPTLAIFGRPLQKTLDGVIGNSGVGWLIAGFIGLLLVGLISYGVRFGDWLILLNLVWITGVFAGLMFYLVNNPERWLHIPLFGLLAYLSARLFRLRTAAELALGYAFVDELIQYYVPGRHGTFEDVQINLFCAAIGLFVYWLQERF